MKIRSICKNFLRVYLLLWSFDSNSTSNCSFDLPPGEQVVLQGNLKITRKLACKIESQEQNIDKVLSFIAIKKSSIINRLTMPEDTLMTLYISDNFGNDLTFELEPESSLGITNDSEEFINLNCNQL